MPGNSTGQENLKGKKSHWGNVDEVIEDNCTEGNFILVYHKFTPYDYYDNALYVQHLGFAKKQNIAWRGKCLSVYPHAGGSHHGGGHHPSAVGLPLLQFPAVQDPAVVFLDR